MVQVVLKNENAITVLKKIESNSIGAVVTDPPYNIGFAGHTWDSNNPLFRIWSECFRTLKHGGYLVAFGDHKRFHKTVAELESIGFVLISGMNWFYPNGTPACQIIGDDHHARVKTTHEPIGLFMKPLLEKTYKKQREIHGNGGLRVSKTVDGVAMTSSVFQYNKPTPSERVLGVEHLAVKQVNKRKKTGRALHRTAERANNHPCVKPIALMAHLCHLVGDPSAPILDPFVGSGSTGMAAAWSGFNFIGIELDRGYHDIAKLRIEYALNNLMPSFPLLAPQRKKMAKSEVKVTDQQSLFSDWIEVAEDVAALVPLRQSVAKLALLRKLGESVSQECLTLVMSANGPINQREGAVSRHAKQVLSIAGVFPNGTNLPFNRLSFVEMLPFVSDNQNAPVNTYPNNVRIPVHLRRPKRNHRHMVRPSADMPLTMRLRKEPSHLTHRQLHRAHCCPASREIAALLQPQQSPQSLQTPNHTLQHSLLALSALARSPPNDAHARAKTDQSCCLCPCIS